jgi:magnesium-transporting ATPase (P-type)
MVIEDWEKCGCLKSFQVSSQAQQNENLYQQGRVYPKGRNFIFVSGIIMVVFGSIGLLSAFVTIISFMIHGSDVLYTLTLLYGAAISGLLLAFGIKGIQNADKPQFAQTFIHMGAALIALYAVEMLFGVVNAFRVVAEIESFLNLGIVAITRVATIIGLVLGFGVNCILPILYIVGGNKLQGK